MAQGFWCCRQLNTPVLVGPWAELHGPKMLRDWLWVNGCPRWAVQPPETHRPWTGRCDGRFSLLLERNINDRNAETSRERDRRKMKAHGSSACRENHQLAWPRDGKLEILKPILKILEDWLFESAALSRFRTFSVYFLFRTTYNKKIARVGQKKETRGNNTEMGSMCLVKHACPQSFFVCLLRSIQVKLSNVGGRTECK